MLLLSSFPFDCCRQSAQERHGRHTLCALFQLPVSELLVVIIPVEVCNMESAERVMCHEKCLMSRLQEQKHKL